MNSFEEKNKEIGRDREIKRSEDISSDFTRLEEIWKYFKRIRINRKR